MGRAAAGMRLLAAYVAYAAVAALVALPISVEQSLEKARFVDRVGTFPVVVSLTRNGVSTLDTGLIGKLFWSETGPGGFGVLVSSSGPPEADGTLASYVTPEFLQANAAFVDDPGAVADLYAGELGAAVAGSVLLYELAAAAGGGLILLLLFRGTAPAVPRRVRSRGGRGAFRAVYVGVALLGTSLVAGSFLDSWDGSASIGPSYPMPGIDQLAFSSPQTRELAQQIQPFIDKNTTRIEERTRGYRAAAVASFEAELPLHAAGLAPRDGEQVVLAEADPQGSLVGTQLRTELYPLLIDALGTDNVVLRTISGDVTSNGTVAERDFVRLEAEATPDVPTIAVKGDHDTDTTVEQLRDNDLVAPDMETVDVGDLRVAGAADPAFKQLFGGLVANPSGVEEDELGALLRDAVDPEEPVVVLLHQPRAAAGYLGISSTAVLRASEGSETTPYDDGIPDVPPGMVEVGHLHDVSGPWVIWNTDGDEVTWTVVSQLGTSGGVEENPTFNRFSTPFSVPLKDVSLMVQYVNPDTGLQTGYAEIAIAVNGTVTIEDRVDVGLLGGEPVPVEDVAVAAPPQ